MPCWKLSQEFGTKENPKNKKTLNVTHSIAAYPLLKCSQPQPQYQKPMNPIIKNEKPKLTVENEVSIETFVILVKSGIELWTRAGAILVSLVEKNPNIYSEVIQKNPDITFEMLLVFEKIG